MTFLDVNIDTSKIIDQLNAIATPTVKQLLELYTKQAIVQGNVDITVSHWLFGFTAAFIVLGTLLVVADAMRDWEGIGFGIGITSMIVGILVAVFAVMNLVNGTQELANPQYYAVQNLLSQIHQ